MSISQTWDNARRRARQGIPGMCLSYTLKRLITLFNEDPQAVQIKTLSVDTATDGATYTVTVNGVAIAIVAGSGTDTEIATQIANAINADPLAGAVCIATTDSADVVITGRNPGQAFTVTESDAKLSLADTQSAAEADAVAFGVAMKHTGTNGTEPELKGALLKGFTAQVVTVDYTYNGTSVLGVRVYEVRGTERILLADAQHTLATDKDTSTDALAAELNAALPAASVIAANAGASGYELTLTAEVAGLEIDVEVYSDLHATVAPSVAYTTGPSMTTSACRAFAGVSQYDSAAEAATVAANVGQYAANAGVKTVQEADVWVTCDESPAQGGTVYVDVSTGLFYAAASSARVALPKASAFWVRDGRDAGDSLALLHVNA